MIIFKIIPKGQGWTWLPPHLMPIHFKNAPAPKGLTLHVKHSLDFSFVFSAPFTYLPEETCFQQAGSSVVEGTS
jgi:hypothetical protein